MNRTSGIGGVYEQAQGNEVGACRNKCDVCCSDGRIPLDNGLQEGGKRLTTVNNTMKAVLENKDVCEERNSGLRIN
jgi:hypothetical protein